MVNNHNKYPKTVNEFNDEYEMHLKRWKTVKSTTKITDEKDFKNNFLAMFNDDEVNVRAVANSNLMQIHFLSDLLAKKDKERDVILTTLLYYGQKKGKIEGVEEHPY